MQIGKATELSILEYAAKLDLNPENIFYQRVRSNSASNSNVQWSIITPDVRSLLLSYAQVDWNITLTRVDSAAGDADLDFVTSNDGVSFKPLMPFTNAQTSQTVSINGNSITLSQPRNFMENLCRLNVSSSESKSCYESQWWSDSGGSYGAAKQGWAEQAAQLDAGLLANERAFQTKLVDTQALAEPATLVGQAAFNGIRYQEPLICPPFNPFAKVQSGMPGYMPMKWMSPVIPNIKQLQVSIQMNAARIDPSILFHRYSRRANAGERPQFRVTNIQADLLLYWYQVPVTMSIPRDPVLQTWNLTEYQNPVGTVADGAEGPRTNSPLIQLESVPGFFVIHARRRQDDGTYRTAPMSSDTDGLGANPRGSYGAAGAPQDNQDGHSLDTHMEIRDLRIQLGSRPDAISTDFSQRQLYDITLKNAKYNGFSLDFQTWKSPVVPYIRYADGNVDSNYVVADSLTLRNQMSKSFVCLQPKDVAQRISGGVRFPNSLLVQANVRARDGACGMRGLTLNYDLFVHVYVNKHWIRISPDRAQYEEQSVTLDSAERLVAGGAVDAGRLTAGSYTAKF